MSLPRFFIDAAASDSRVSMGAECIIPLPASVYQHMQTLRLKEREHFVLVDSTDAAYEFEFVRFLAGPAVVAHCVARILPPVGPVLTLVQGLSKGERMEQTIRQATEIGVRRIIPLLSERVIVRLGQEAALKKQERWRRIACSAAEQAGLAAVPQLTLPVNLEDSLNECADCDGLICAWEEQPEGSLCDAIAAIKSHSGKVSPHIALYVGPEGGFSAAEVERLQAAGALVVSLGSTILRTETAGVIASALVLYELGGLGRHRIQPNTFKLRSRICIRFAQFSRILQVFGAFPGNSCGSRA